MLRALLLVAALVASSLPVSGHNCPEISNDEACRLNRAAEAHALITGGTTVAKFSCKEEEGEAKIS